MKCPKLVLLLLLFTLLQLPPSSSTAEQSSFLQCLIHHQSHNTSSISDFILTQTSPSYTSVLQTQIQNLRLLSPDTPRPLFIVTPIDESQIWPTIDCSKHHGLQLRIRSAGHDFEGLSYHSHLPFVLLDLFNLRAVHVDPHSATAWVQSGATLGEVYYAITATSRNFAFPAGYWSGVGVGGHLSGGGYGPLIRKYGIASDNVIDARFMDVNGRIMDRESMGEDLFWAIRGGGGGNFGVVLAWKLRLALVPDTVTICRLDRDSSRNATQLVHQWQFIAPKMPKELLIEIHSTSAVSPETGGRTVLARFNPVFLGKLDELISLMNERFPAMGISENECEEMGWREAVVRLSQFPVGTPSEVLLNRTAPPRYYAKQKADYVEEPIPIEGLEGLWEFFHRMDAGSAEIVWTPYGGRMSEISEWETPYPHRGENLFMLYEGVYWDGEKEGARSPRHLSWMNEMHSYLAKYVSKSPRGAYVNYRDLDLGVNDAKGQTSYEEASVWGVKYYKGNFERLVKVKTMIDPGNFFRNEQSIPPLQHSCVVEPFASSGYEGLQGTL